MKQVHFLIDKSKIPYLLIVFCMLCIACPPQNYNIELCGEIIGFQKEQKYNIRIIGQINRNIDYDSFSVNTHGEYLLKFNNNLAIKGLTLSQNDTVISVLMCADQFQKNPIILDMITNKKYFVSVENNNAFGNNIDFIINKEDSSFYDLNLDRIRISLKLTNSLKNLMVNLSYFKEGYSLKVIQESFNPNYRKEYFSNNPNNGNEFNFNVEDIPNSHYFVILTNQYGWSYLHKYETNQILNE